MGCFGSSPVAPEEIIPNPEGDNPCSFVVKKAGVASSHYNVYNDQKQKWLYVRNDSSWFSSKSEFQIENWNRGEDGKGETLVRVEIEGKDADINRDVDWEGDSDDSDFSLDDLFDFDNDDELKVKLKWKFSRRARFLDSDNKEYASLKFKAKGKSKAELTIERDDEGNKTSERMESKTKVKKAFYTLEWGGEQVEVEVEGGHWQDYDRKWSCPMFDAQYDAKWGTDEVKIDTKGKCPGHDALGVGFALAYFLHPAQFVNDMDSKARGDARRFMPDDPR